MKTPVQDRIKIAPPRNWIISCAIVAVSGLVLAGITLYNLLYIYFVWGEKDIAGLILLLSTLVLFCGLTLILAICLLNYVEKEGPLFHSCSFYGKKLCTVNTELPTYYAIFKSRLYDGGLRDRGKSPFIALSNKPFVFIDTLGTGYNAKVLLVMQYDENIIPPSQLEKWYNARELYSWDVYANGQCDWKDKNFAAPNRPGKCRILSLQTIDRHHTFATVELLKKEKVIHRVLVLNSQVRVGMIAKLAYTCGSVDGSQRTSGPNVFHGWIIPAEPDSREPGL